MNFQDLSAEAQNLYNITKTGTNEQFLEAAKATANKGEDNPRD